MFQSCATSKYLTNASCSLSLGNLFRSTRNNSGACASPDLLPPSINTSLHLLVRFGTKAKSNTRCIFLKNCKYLRGAQAGSLQFSRDIASAPLLKPDLTTASDMLHVTAGSLLRKYKSIPISNTQVTKAFLAVESRSLKFS